MLERSQALTYCLQQLEGLEKIAGAEHPQTGQSGICASIIAA
jgi:hypothetical protein